MKKNTTKAFYIVVLLCILNTVLTAQEKDLRIVSLVPAVTKSLQLLELEENIVGCTSFCPVKDNQHTTEVASAIDVNIEQVYTLKPDLVITSSLIPPESSEHLKKLGLQVAFFHYPKSFNDLCQQLIRLGDLTNKSELANAIVHTAKQKLDLAQKTIPEAPKPLIFIEVGANPLFTAVPNTFMDDYITFVNGKNLAHDFTTGSITRETVLLRNPDIIFIVTMGIVGQQEKDTWHSYPSLSAAQNNKIFVLDADKTCSPTPTSFVYVVEEMIKRIYH